MKSFTPEFITSLTPIFIASIGGIIGVAVLVSPAGNDTGKATAGMGLAGTAIAGAAGLAQSSKREMTISEQDPKLFVQNKEI